MLPFNGLLIYGFGPFDGYETNISQQVVLRLPPLPNCSTAVFDVCFSRQMFMDVFERLNPSHILGLGQTAHGDRLRVERVARNEMAERGGEVVAIVPGASSKTLSWCLPEDERCEVGNDAGQYVCNFSMWAADEWVRQRNGLSAFVHVPAQHDVESAVDFVCRVARSL